MNRFVMTAMAFSFSIFIILPSYARDFYGSGSRGALYSKSNNTYRNVNRPMDKGWGQKHESLNQNSQIQGGWGSGKDSQRRGNWDYTKWKDPWKEKEDYRKQLESHEKIIKNHQQYRGKSRNGASVIQRGYYSNGLKINNSSR